MLEKMKAWKPPTDWLKITTIDAHTAGEPFRVIIDGYPELEGNTILERRSYARENFDYLRTALMWEPRGHADMYGCIITPPVTPGADIGILFMHNEGYSTMCGHGIIGIVRHRKGCAGDRATAHTHPRDHCKDRHASGTGGRQGSD